MDYKKLNVIGGWITFFIALYVYGSTIEPTTSFWDCGEYIATSNKLEVGHPPGAPTFMMIGRVFTMFSSPENVAVMINFMSALSSALTILFLFWIITYMAKKFLPGEKLEGGNLIAVLGSGFVGALAFTFSDTFWFSAVEGEVYAMSSFCTALVFWAILRWEEVADEPHSNRWLIFIMYIIGLSIGVHLLNLLAIPAIVFVYYFKRYEVSNKGMAIAFAISIAILGGVQNVLIPQVVNIAAKFELLFTNGFGMPFHTGSIVYGLLVIAGITYGLMYTQRKNKVLANTVILSFTVLMIGYTSFGMILIRSNADVPIDENNPENMVNLLSYLKREQYGDLPLLHGQYFNSPLDNKKPYNDGDPVYYPSEKTGRYEIADDKKSSSPNYAKEFTGFFPRMWSSKSNHVRAYKAWSNFEGTPLRYRKIGKQEAEIIYKPTFGENIRFFVDYQLYWMWGRYLMWNFAGRQNDIQGHGIDPNQYLHGNWVSGIRFLDEARLGNLEFYPDELKYHKSYNKYYLLPLILGLLGLILQAKYDWKGSVVITLLFVMTGIAIAVYLNNYPYQPRERDYAFVGSFFAFAIWIGLGVVGLFRFLREKVPASALAPALTIISLIAVPGLMAIENWDDHDRSDRYTAREIAKNYLDSCAPNAILFTNGDNDTFPLWYVQEVEGYRTDVRVVNLMLLNTDWYIESMQRKAYEGEPIPSSLDKSQYRQGTRDYVQFAAVPGVDQDEFYNIDEIVRFMSSDAKRQTTGDGRKMNIIPARKFKLKVDKEKVLANGTVDPSLADQVVDQIEWNGTGNYVLKSEMIVWDMLANFNWDRPIYFSITMGDEAFFGLQNYFQQEGFAFRLVPIKTEPQSIAFREYGRVDVEQMYDRMMNQFQWGGYEDSTLWMDENNLRFITNIRFTFNRLAKELLRQGDTERAVAVLDRCSDVTVHSNMPYNTTLLPTVELYYQAGEIEKGTAIAMELLERESQYLDYFISQDDQRLVTMSQLMNNSVRAMSQMVQMTQRFNVPQAQIFQDRYSSYANQINALR